VSLAAPLLLFAATKLYADSEVFYNLDLRGGRGLVDWYVLVFPVGVVGLGSMQNDEECSSSLSGLMCYLTCSAKVEQGRCELGSLEN
jgi:hypothetical protein